MKSSIGFLTLSASLLFGQENEEFDFNFDGHMDYRVLTLDNAKGSQFDVFIFDPKKRKHIKDETLSGQVYPHPDPKARRVNCLWFGGHSGALFTGSVYSWNGSGFVYEFSVTQDAVSIDGKIEYVMVKARMVDGRPHIFSITQGDPDSNDYPISIE